MNTTKQLQQIMLDQWAVRCKEQFQSDPTLKQRFDQNGYTIHTCNYWKLRLKENYIESALHNIVPIASPIPGVLPHSYDSGNTNTISVLLGNTAISLDSSTSDEISCHIMMPHAILRDAAPSFSAVYVVCGYTDMRYGMDTLAVIIEQRYHLPLFGPDTLFLFCDRRASKIKVLLWKGDGFLLPTKHVESGHFSCPRNFAEARKLTSEQFGWLKKGFSIDPFIREDNPFFFSPRCIHLRLSLLLRFIHRHNNECPGARNWHVYWSSSRNSLSS